MSKKRNEVSIDYKQPTDRKIIVNTKMDLLNAPSLNYSGLNSGPKSNLFSTRLPTAMTNHNPRQKLLSQTRIDDAEHRDARSHSRARFLLKHHQRKIKPNIKITSRKGRHYYARNLFKLELWIK
jgi:hypothetical protein